MVDLYEIPDSPQPFYEVGSITTSSLEKGKLRHRQVSALAIVTQVELKGWSPNTGHFYYSLPPQFLGQLTGN